MVVEYEPQAANNDAAANDGAVMDDNVFRGNGCNHDVRRNNKDNRSKSHRKGNLLKIPNPIPSNNLDSNAGNNYKLAVATPFGNNYNNYLPAERVLDILIWAAVPMLTFLFSAKLSFSQPW